MNNLIKNNKFSILKVLALVIFCIGIIFMTCFHEPFVDEFAAYGTAKESLSFILFDNTHYECHPPLWHLILKCFVLLNISPDIAIRIPTILFAVLSSWLLIFKSPFQLIYQLTLPFTFFIFYQQAIINRPYSLFTFAMLLCAILYKNRNKRPFKFILGLCLLSLTSAYGLIFATGISIAWGIELLVANKKKFFNSKQLLSLLLLFAFCVFLSINMIPYPNTTRSILLSLPNYIRVLYCSFGILSDATIFDLVNYSLKINTIIFYIGIFYGLCLSIFLIYIFKKMHKFIQFFLPYVIFLLFSYFIYLYTQHLSLVFVFLIFIFWTNFEELKFLLNKYEKIILNIIVVVTIIIQLYWSFCAYYNDFKYEYQASKKISEYIIENNLTKENIYCADRWLALSINAYFKGEKVVNNEWLLPDNSMLIFRSYKNRYEIQELMQVLKNDWEVNGYPKFVISGKSPDEYITERIYKPVSVFSQKKIWKNNGVSSNITLYKIDI